MENIENIIIKDKTPITCDNVNCENEEMIECKYVMLKECPRTCAYYREIIGIDIGVGAICDSGLIKRLEKQNDKNN